MWTDVLAKQIGQAAKTNIFYTFKTNQVEKSDFFLTDDVSDLRIM